MVPTLIPIYQFQGIKHLSYHKIFRFYKVLTLLQSLNSILRNFLALNVNVIGYEISISELSFLMKAEVLVL